MLFQVINPVAEVDGMKYMLLATIFPVYGRGGCRSATDEGVRPQCRLVSVVPTKSSEGPTVVCVFSGLITRGGRSHGRRGWMLPAAVLSWRYVSSGRGS